MATRCTKRTKSKRKRSECNPWWIGDGNQKRAQQTLKCSIVRMQPVMNRGWQRFPWNILNSGLFFSDCIPFWIGDGNMLCIATSVWIFRSECNPWWIGDGNCEVFYADGEFYIVRMQPVMNRGWQHLIRDACHINNYVRMQPVMNRGWQHIP